MAKNQFALLKQHLGRLACPFCQSTLDLGEEKLTCSGCDRNFPLDGGIPRLARPGGQETWQEGAAVEADQEYQERYEKLDKAEGYNQGYAESAGRRWNTRREGRLLGKLLSTQPRSEVLLDLPCGGGRLSSFLTASTDCLIESDIAHGQLLHGLDRPLEGAEQLWMTASVFHLPFRDGSLDGAVSIRLSHHLPTMEEQNRLFDELLRVVRRFVILTFFDTSSLKERIRRFRRRFGYDKPTYGLSVPQVREMAAQRGAKLEIARLLSRIGSAHRYALITKNDG